MRESKRRAIAMLALALVLAGGSVALARSWLHHRLASLAGPPPAPALATTRLVVAAAPLRFGDEVRAEHLRLIEWPEAAVPEGAFGALEPILGPGGAQPRVVLRPIEKDEPVLAAKLTGFGARASLSTLIAPGMRATTIPVDDVRGVAGLVRPGDRVDVLLTRERAAGGAGRDPVTTILLQNMKVLGLDQDAGAGSGRAGAARTVTLEVTAVQAQKLTLADKLGTLSLALRHRDTPDAAPAGPITRRDLRIGTAEPASARPRPRPEGGRAGPDRAQVPRGKSRTFSVRIVRALEVSEYEVRPEAAAAPALAKPPVSWLVPWSCAAPLGGAEQLTPGPSAPAAACPAPGAGG